MAVLFLFYCPQTQAYRYGHVAMNNSKLIYAQRGQGGFYFFIFLRMSSFLKLNMDLFHELLKKMLML